MTIALVPGQKAAIGAAPALTTIVAIYPANTTPGSLLVVHCGGGVPVTSVTDDGGNVWLKAVAEPGPFTQGSEIWYSFNAETCRNVTVHWGSATGFRYATVSEYSGVRTSPDPLDKSDSDLDAGSAAVSVTTPDVTPSAAGALVYIAGRNTGAGLGTIGAPFTQLSQAGQADVDGYQIQGVLAAAVHAIVNNTGDTHWVAQLAAFLPAGKLTTAQQIIDAAIASSLANDGGRSELSNNLVELLNVLNRRIQSFYVLAGTPSEQGGAGRGDYFATEANVILRTGFVALPAAAFRHSFVRATDGVAVAVVPQIDLDIGRAEMPPAVVYQRDKVKSAGRAGDPAVGESLTVRYTPLPALLTDGAHFIGATTATDATTSAWPEAVGNPYLVAWLCRYLALKAGDRDPAELQAINDDLQEAAQQLAVVVGIEATTLIEDHGGGS